ncbi:CocE/NonD family hydrolase [Streptomyces sp. NPDC002143]
MSDKKATPMRVREPQPPAEGGYPGFRPGTAIEDGLRIDRDITVTMRDGSPIYVDLYRPEHADGPLAPVIAWSPYGKHGGPGRAVTHLPEAGIEAELSPHATTEAPDPAAWCPRGYAIVYPDPRGTWNTPGTFTMGTRQEAEDYHDLIEWAGTQEWSNGRVGITGVSYLGFSQWRAASTNPPHLAAINPWEGLNDFYREWGYIGGIPEERFIRFMAEHSTGYGLEPTEDFRTLVREHPLLDDYWEGKEADASRINVPAYVVAGWSSHGLHLRGTLEAYKQLNPEHTWLETHGDKIWRYYYRPDCVARQLQFFDWALQGVDNGWEQTPRVRLAVREHGSVSAVRSENEWPLERTRHEVLYLDAESGSLRPDRPHTASEVSYHHDAEGSQPHRAVFDYEFHTRTELTGHTKLRLWLEAESANDADVFVAIQKISSAGEHIGFPYLALRDDGPVSLGWLRASHRALDAARSTPQQPWHPHTHEDLLEPGTPVALEIELWPSSTSFSAGERLRVVVQSGDVYPTKDGIFGHDHTRNEGRYIIRTGGPYDSHLLVPAVPE